MKAVALRYAQALVDVALAHNVAEKIREELATYGALAAESVDLRNFLTSPAVSRRDKHAVIDRLATRLGSSKHIRNFLHLLVDHRRTALLAEIRREFAAVLHARMKVADAEITSARELTPQERAALTAALEKVLGKRVEARYTLDAELIAGARVRVGSTIYDGSVREQLVRLRARLAAG